MQEVPRRAIPPGFMPPTTVIMQVNFHMPVPTSTPLLLHPPTPVPSILDDLNKETTATTSPIIPDKTFYRRDLPEMPSERSEQPDAEGYLTVYRSACASGGEPNRPSLTSFNSTTGRKLFKESLADGSAEAFLQLSGNLAHQSEPAYCALGSLAIVLNALEVDPKRPWKGPWRWYDETLLECCSPLSQIKEKGLTFSEFACLASCNSLQVTSKRGNQVSLEEFRQDISDVCRGDGTTQLVVSFSRKTLGQTGDGHFSPIGAFHADEDKVLVLDVARFKYPSYFVSVEQLYEALKPIDKETGLSRGYFLLRKPSYASIPSTTSSSTSTSTITSTSLETTSLRICKLHPPPPTHTWPPLTHLLSTQLPTAFAKLSKSATIKQTLQAFISTLPKRDPSTLISLRSPGVDLASAPSSETDSPSEIHRKTKAMLLKALRASKLHRELSRVVEPHLAPLALLILLSVPTEVLKGVGSCEVRHHLDRERDLEGMSDVLKREVVTLRGQLGNLVEEFKAKEGEKLGCGRCGDKEGGCS
ncbi:hypothetical protein HDV05_008650 [Chytridiales sp. JEL 0842]|nr:hypothetical protein HDV05_008650 [Chytridiales sp. JEL 0842]